MGANLANSLYVNKTMSASVEQTGKVKVNTSNFQPTKIIHFVRNALIKNVAYAKVNVLIKENVYFS